MSPDSYEGLTVKRVFRGWRRILLVHDFFIQIAGLIPADDMFLGSAGPFLRPGLTIARASCAAAVKRGRRPPLEAARSALEGGCARSHARSGRTGRPRSDCRAQPYPRHPIAGTAAPSSFITPPRAAPICFRPRGLQTRIRWNRAVPTTMLHSRSLLGAWRAGPILIAACFSHSPGRLPAHPEPATGLDPVVRVRQRLSGLARQAWRACILLFSPLLFHVCGPARFGWPTAPIAFGCLPGHAVASVMAPAATVIAPAGSSPVST